jgi:hypothetical protein
MITKSQATRATNNTRITHSLKSLITNDHLSQLWNLEKLEALIVSWNGLQALVLNVEGWNAWVFLNGGGWGCIYSHQPLLSCCPFLPTTDGPRPWSGRSAPADQRLKMQQSEVTAISMAILHLMRRQMSDKGSRERSGRAPQTVREDAIIHFTEPVTFGFFGSSPTGRSAPEAGRSARSLGRCLLFHRTVRSRDMCFCIGSVRGSFRCCGRSAAKARTVRAWPVFPKSLSCPE